MRFKVSSQPGHSMILWKSQTLKNLLRTWKPWKIGLCWCPVRQQPFNTNVTRNKGALRCNCCFSVTFPEIRAGLLQTASHLLVEKQNEAAAMWVNTHVPVKYLMSQSVLKSGVLKDEILPVSNYCVCTDTEGSPAPQQSHRRRGLISLHNPVPTLTQPLVSPQSTSEAFQLL